AGLLPISRRKHQSQRFNRPAKYRVKSAEPKPGGYHQQHSPGQGEPAFGNPGRMESSQSCYGQQVTGAQQQRDRREVVVVSGIDYVVQREVVKGRIEYRDRLAELQIPLRASHYLPDVERMEQSPEYRQEDRSCEQIRRVVKLLVPDNIRDACCRQRQGLQNYP